MARGTSARKKADSRKKQRSRVDTNRPNRKKAGPGVGSIIGGFFRFLWLPWMRRSIILVAVLAVLFWQWDNTASWFDGVAESTLGLFGWGLVLIALAVVIVAGIIFRRQISAFIIRWKLYQWNKWLGVAAFFFAVWGVLALFDLGGRFGETLIGGDVPIGVLRVIGLFALGIVLVIPRLCWRAVKRSVSWLVELFKMPPPPARPRREEPEPPLPFKPAAYTRPDSEKAPSGKIIPPPVLVPPEIPLREPVAGKEATPAAAEAVASAVEPQRDLKQVAQEVWRKYGESPSLVVVDGWRLPPIDILEKTTEIE